MSRRRSSAVGRRSGRSSPSPATRRTPWPRHSTSPGRNGPYRHTPSPLDGARPVHERRHQKWCPTARTIKFQGLAYATRQFRLDQPVVGPSVPLTDAQWARIEPSLPDRTPKRGGRWRDHREVIDGIAFKFQTGTQWVHLPEKYGNWRGVYNRLRMWAVDGTWERVFTALMAQADADENLSWAVSVDSTIVRAHQHAAGARKEGPQLASRATTPSAGPAAG
ncbi:IS5 family transposase [Streptomyces sp. NPDC058683]|uniref:IS5 family transposase n=1 Tax=Streptomyces sp. NPDC058683 TaxID=3346597 RepID=UPI00365B629F